MAKIPAGTVACLDPVLCKGSRFHYSTTAAACGATKRTVKASETMRMRPPRQQADPSCPQHGIEPQGEYDVAALNRQQVVAGVMAGTAILGLCSCAGDPSPDVTGNPGPTIEQTIEPTASAEFVLRTATEDDWPSIADADGYVFSEVPQGEAEQFIFDSYPELWAQGVRVLSPKMVPGYNYGDPAAPGAVVQYINGERYEGTISLPLGFRGQIAAPESLPSDAVGNVIAGINGDGSWPAGNAGQGGYIVDINEKDPKGTALEVYQFVNNSTSKKLGSTMYFSNWEEAWAYAQANGYSVPGMERALYPGEVSRVTALRVDGGTAMSMWVYDSSTSSWALAVSFE